jgi:hypothetical protein
MTWNTWAYGISGPKGTPKEALTVLEKAFEKATKPELSGRCQEQGAQSNIPGGQGV